MSSVSRSQYPSGVVVMARVEHYPTQMIAPRVISSELVLVSSAGAPAATFAAQPDQAPVAGSAWDPHEVWLTRVKKPREQQSS
jgi:hypothetical protein